MEIQNAFSVVDVHPSTSAPLPEAVWYQEKSSSSTITPLSSSDADERRDAPGFFVSLLQRWDVASDQHESKSVFYKVSHTQFSGKNEGDDATVNPIFTLKLPTKLAVCDSPHQEDDSGSHTSRRVPLLTRFSDNQRVLVMQFSPTHVRIAVPSLDNDTGKSVSKKEPSQHWTVELLSSAKDPYAPIVSLADVMPKIRLVATAKSLPSQQEQQKSQSMETILPGGIFWLDQSYGNVHADSDYQQFMFVMATNRSLLCYTVTLNRLDPKKPTLNMELAHIFSHPLASTCWWSPKSLLLVVGSYQGVQEPRSTEAKQQQQRKLKSYMFMVPPTRNQPQQQQQQQLYLRTYFFSADGPFTSHREVLRNPLILPLRLERPPPVCFKAFPVGTPPAPTSRDAPSSTKSTASSKFFPTNPSSSTTNQQGAESSQLSLTSSSSSKHKRDKFPACSCVSVVHLYSRAFIVDIGSETFVGHSGDNYLEVTLHELDRENFTVDMGQIRQVVVLPKRIRSSKEDVLILTLDDILCISFRRSMFHLFLDIKDVGSESCFVVENYSTKEEEKFLHGPKPALFISPNYLFLSSQGIVLPLSLSLERLAPAVSKPQRCNFCMLLRRAPKKHNQRQSAYNNSISGREIVYSRLKAVGTLPSVGQRLNWMNHVARPYTNRISLAQIYVQNHLTSSHVTPFEWDVQASLPIMFQCALLPADAEFLPAVCDLFEDESTCALIGPAPKLASNAVLFQKELLVRLLIPMTRIVLEKEKSKTKTDENKRLLQRVAEIVLSYIGALEQHGGRPCPALGVFTFAVLWRLGDAQLLNAILESGSLFPSLAKKTTPASPSSRAASFLCIKWQASLLLTLVEKVKFGSLCLDNIDEMDSQDSGTLAFRNRTLQISLSLLSSRNDYRFPAALISQLLSQGRLIEAMSVASAVLHASNMSSSNGSGIRDRPSACLIQARRLNPGEDYFALAMARLRAIRDPSEKNGHLARLFESVYSFLLRWDPQYLQTMSPETVSPSSRIQDDIVLAASCNLSKRRMSRRPSWTCTTIIENWMVSKRRAQESYHHYSVASGQAARIVNALSMNSLHFESVRHDQGNEPVRLRIQKLVS